MRRVASLIRQVFGRTPATRRARLAVTALEARAVPSATVVGPTTPTMPPPYPEVTGRVWRDLNSDGVQEPAERGIAFVTLQLYQGNQLVGTTTTDGLGNYAFNVWNVTNGTATTADDGLVAGLPYEIRVPGSQSALAGLRPTVTNAGTSDTLDSDAVATPTGTALDFTMGGGAIYPNNDFGYAMAATIGGVAWGDANNNGVKDAKEAGLSGVTVRLLDATGTNQVATATTTADGSYQFTCLVPGTYVVEVASTNFATGGPLAGYGSSTGALGQATGPFEGSKTPDPNTGKKGAACDHGTTTASGAVQCMPVVVLAGSPTNNAVDFGFVRAGSLSGRVFVDVNGNGQMDAEDTAGVAGVKVTAAGPAGVFTTTTDSTGAYSFANLPAASYTLTESPPVEYRMTTPALATTTVSPSTPALANFGEARVVDLDVRVSALPAVNVGGVQTLTYRVRNVGTLDATGVTLMTPLPKSLKVLGVKAAGATYDPTGQRATIPTLAAGAEVIITIRVRATQVASYALTAIVQGSQPEDQVANNRSVARFQVMSPDALPARPAFAFLSSAFRHI